MEDSVISDLTVRRFSGLDRLLGVASANRVRKAHVTVVGIGGVGSWAAEALARSGVGQITLVDLDHVSESNINRQIQALESTIGMAKVDAMASRIASINPHCIVNRIDDFASKENWQSIVPDHVDGVIDACDQVQAKMAMATWAMRNRKLLICVGAAGGKTHAHRVDVADLSKTTNDPLLASLRYQLRKAGDAPKGGTTIGLTCVFSNEPVKKPDISCSVGGGDGSLNCQGYGSLVTVTATFGLVSAGWMIEKLSKAKSV
ncbi:tRNA threonylcarbamoyladenosine dehydratase [Rhodoferax aquaticus]|uniref:tRNA threonylcarbamoyladenosine dehydratase n=1 Tax=Rhodoferax aquaticus TaxID=2527691 RepID=A0A515ENS9_9BURK|nr:tRNA threonylcarbamoyladenosine dehydratase [Rhodoferax aquaticus]QDL54304.1 tRNA threonylcarbamoyladenosine dehydratase [Rhodoferax aquaticus]